MQENKLPSVKKNIKSFLRSEEGKISKKSILQLGIAVTILSLFLSEHVQADVEDCNHSNAHHNHSNAHSNCHTSHGNHGSCHGNHGNHSSCHDSHADHTSCHDSHTSHGNSPCPACAGCDSEI